MDEYKINLTLQFQDELDKIYYYIYYSLHAPKTANKLHQKIKKSVYSLNFSPERYSKIYGLNNLKNENIRKMPVDNYIIIYQVNNLSRQVFILHIFHGKQNYFNQL